MVDLRSGYTQVRGPLQSYFQSLSMNAAQFIESVKKEFKLFLDPKAALKIPVKINFAFPQCFLLW